MMFDKHANLKYKFGNRHFWVEGYYVSTVGVNEATIKKYIQDQERHGIAMDKLSVRENEDPFKGSKEYERPLRGSKRGKGNRLEPLRKVKASALRRWPVTIGLLALVHTTRLTGGCDLIWHRKRFQIEHISIDRSPKATSRPRTRCL